ncbi:hypothetical protein FDG2_0645 [Candidatus Protofrankia californiensis]|uniref:Uncharacterized protein n=1 Tax=Candidatus Protofrankia californiensis TaxID=1839754 RepID=A0A1C3NU27_9ACTN|nr:hypothetical protein FDG2_0645 [Candidatus Protofrankia californiensis]
MKNTISWLLAGLGGTAERKVLQTAPSDNWFTDQEIQVRSWTPLLIDFPAPTEGDDAVGVVLVGYCAGWVLYWLESGPAPVWYQQAGPGFRRSPPAARCRADRPTPIPLAR